MNKEYIESLLRDEEMINLISKLRTQFSVHMTEFYFFRTFFEALSTLNIAGNTKKVNTILNGKVGLNCFISLHEPGTVNRIEVQYNPDQLQNTLYAYNHSLSDMSFRESTEALIDIFLDLLG